MSGPEQRSRKPGDTDPMIPIKIGESLTLLNVMAPDNFDSSISADGRRYMNLGLSSLGAAGVNPSPWWQQRVSPSDDEMTYQCDARLGNPSEVDCSRIEWNQLAPGLDTLSVGPGNPTFLHSSKQLVLQSCC